jgi:lysophospholipase L1-like esterase
VRIAFVGDSLTEGIPGSSYFAILRERLPGHTLINLGKANDTVVRLYHRLTRLRFGEPLDIAFLWVGVNDVAGSMRWSFRAVDALLRNYRATNPEEFRTHYQATLELLCRHARRVIAVAPLLKGENVGNPRNRQLEVLSGVIEELTSHYEQAEFLDLRTVFVQKLAGRRVSDYVSNSVIRVVLDALTLRSQERIDRKAAERGLHLTLDGIHLNGAGAETVAEVFMQVIRSHPFKPSPNW